MVVNGVEKVLDRINEIQSRFFKPSQKISSRKKFSEMIEQSQEELYSRINRFSCNNNMKIEINRFDPIIKKASEKYGVPEKLIKSVIKQESNFNPTAVSIKGAKGLMQLMPETAKKLGVKDIFNPEENINGGTKYLRDMLDRFDGDIVNALAAYNAGPEKVEKYSGVPDYRETKNYIKNILKNIDMF